MEPIRTHHMWLVMCFLRGCHTTADRVEPPNSILTECKEGCESPGTALQDTVGGCSCVSMGDDAANPPLQPPPPLPPPLYILHCPPVSASLSTMLCSWFVFLKSYRFHCEYMWHDQVHKANHCTVFIELAVYDRTRCV